MCLGRVEGGRESGVCLLTGRSQHIRISDSDENNPLDRKWFFELVEK
jgi:hypothetical protein